MVAAHDIGRFMHIAAKAVAEATGELGEGASEGELIRELIDGAAILFSNEYESHMIEQKTGWSADEVLAKVGLQVTTLGADGVRIKRQGEEDIVVPAAKDVAADAEIILEHGKPLIFGKEKTLGLRVKPGVFDLEVVPTGKKGISETDILVHDETNRRLACMLALMEPPSMPVSIGVLYCHPTSSYEDGVKDHFEEAEKHATGTDLNALLRRGHTWTTTN